MASEINELILAEATSPACINLQMMRSSHYILKAYDEAYRPFGIRATQMPVLGAVARRQPVTIRQIADELESERSVMSRKLLVMEKSGWVKEDPDAVGKEKMFLLTRKGKELIQKILPVRLEVQQRLTSVLTEEEMNLLLTLCNKLKEVSQ
ncbi:MAG: MarR family winged helix-turn-helix transcriptional regulator [Acidiferrobacterales bacterium]